MRQHKKTRISAKKPCQMGKGMADRFRDIAVHTSCSAYQV